MEHRKYKDLIQLFVFGELSKGEIEQLENHVASCSECRTYMEEQMKMKSLLAKEILIEPDENLLNEARMELRAVLRKERSIQTIPEKISLMFSNIFPFSYKIAISGLVVLAIGFLFGYLVFNSSDEQVPELVKVNDQNNYALFSKQNNDGFIEDNVKISNINFIDQDMNDGEIEFTFEAVKPVHVKGSVNDPRIQNILMYSILNAQNPGVRLNSINAIGENQPDKLDTEIRDALITSVKYDDNPGVRREALKLLKKFPYDGEIKKTLLFVLSNDENSGLRIEAINGLVEARKEGNLFNEQELSIFKKKVEMDENNYIRYQAKTVLKENN